MKDVEFVTPLHPLVRAMAADARRRLRHVYPGERGLPPRRLAARSVAAGESPSVVFTFLGVVSGEGGPLEERVMAVRVALDGTILGDAATNQRYLEGAADTGEVEPSLIDRLFRHRFDQLRDAAAQEAQRWLDARAELLRRRRQEQAAVLLRDLEVGVADRLREIEDEERRARGLVEDTGQQRLFGEQEGVRGFEARRAAVSAHEEERRQEIAAFAQVNLPEPPRPLGALFLVPEGMQA